MSSLVFLFVFSLTNLAQSTEKPLIISGFDDVLRQAENTGLLKAAIKIFEDDKTFAGMPELYSTLSSEKEEPRFFLVSAISNWFDGRIDQFLVTEKFPTYRKYLRSWLTEWSIEKFKIAKIAEILNSHPDRKFVIIFDNSKASLELAEKIPSLFGDKIEAIYLHTVVQKNIPSNAIAYYSAFDIALAEHQTNRISADEVSAVGNAILNEPKREALFPSYAVCPEEYDPCVGRHEDIQTICAKVRTHVRNLCQKLP